MHDEESDRMDNILQTYKLVSKLISSIKTAKFKNTKRTPKNNILRYKQITLANKTQQTFSSSPLTHLPSFNIIWVIPNVEIPPKKEV
jgi:hypothetical protein